MTLQLELAALATAALDDADIVATAEYSYGHRGDFDAALLRLTDDTELIVRRPTSSAAADEQLADVRALRSMTEGIRSRLPFAVQSPQGVLHNLDVQAVVTTFLPGDVVEREPLEADDPLVPEIGRAIAAIHALPRAFVREAGLPEQDAEASRRAAREVIEAARETRRLPVSIDRRWRAAVDDDAMWQFQPNVVHGALTLASLVTDGSRITGVLEWSDLRVGDPARDVRWLPALPADVRAAVMAAYQSARGASVDRQIGQRARLYAELDVARWLLHGVRERSESIIADAEQLLDGLVEEATDRRSAPIVHETLPILDVLEVRELLRDSAARRHAGVEDHDLGPRAEGPVGGDDADADAEEEDLFEDGAPRAASAEAADEKA